MVKRNEAFDQVAKLYDEIRPSYPEELIDDIVKKTGVTSESSLLEIGAGTGKATVQLAKYGPRIHCIEIGQNMADILLDKCSVYPKVTVDVTSFETWEPGKTPPFDVIYCAQAFHWIAPEIKYKKCHTLLKDNGFLALFWYSPVDEPSEAQKEIDSLMQKYIISEVQGDKNTVKSPENQDGRLAEIIASGLFKNVEKYENIVESTLSPEEYLKAMNSASAYAVLPEDTKIELNEKIKEVFEKHGGVAKSNLFFSLYIAEKA